MQKVRTTFYPDLFYWQLELGMLRGELGHTETILTITSAKGIIQLREYTTIAKATLS